MTIREASENRAGPRVLRAALALTFFLGLVSAAANDGGEPSAARGAGHDTHAADPPTETDNSTGSPDGRDGDLNALLELLDRVQSFRADVTQLIVERSGDVLEESQIRFMLRRPDGFYWETLSPYPELIVTDGESLWNYQPDLLQVTVEDWEAEQAGLAAQLLSGRSEGIAEAYQVEQLERSGGTREFLLEPRDSGSLYEQVTLSFDEEGVLESIHVASADGQRTLWQFHNQEVNVDIDETRFRFEVPEELAEEIEVIDSR